ncbi:MAG: Wzz/FepE/Etk N-terminal domain-containing protein [Cytophagales bacterium]|nr:Wzz/FepE/Etk N-terminal domain-containing protein [Cytophagales bacterium]
MSDINATEKPSEIDLLELLKLILDKRKKIIIVNIIVLFFGLFVAIFSPIQWKSSGVFIPQSSDGINPSNLGGLASLAGINLSMGGSSSEIPPALYSKIASSVDFRLDLLDVVITVPEKGDLTYADYYENVYRRSLLEAIKYYSTDFIKSTLRELVVGKGKDVVETEHGFIQLNKTQFEHLKRISDQLSVNWDKQEQVVGISFTMPAALMSAQMTNHAKNLLQEQIIDFRISKAKEQLTFVTNQFQEKKIEFEKVQTKLAEFKDKNKDISSSFVENRLRVLESEYDFASNIYIELGKQLEQAKIQVKQNTPVFSEVQAVNVPYERTAPRRSTIVILSAILGLILGVAYVIVMALIGNVRSSLRDSVRTNTQINEISE